LETNDKQFVYLGNCITGLDTDALSKIGIGNASDMARKDENAKEISKEEFYAAVCEIPSAVANKIKNHDNYYLYDEEDDFYFVYDSDDDIHYFFGK